MKKLVRPVVGLLIGLGLSVSLVPPTSAAEIPTGAARIVTKVQTRIAISKNTLLFNIAPIQANAETALAKTRGG